MPLCTVRRVPLVDSLSKMILLDIGDKSLKELNKLTHQMESRTRIEQ